MSIIGLPDPSKYTATMPQGRKPSDPPINWQGPVLNGQKILEQSLTEHEAKVEHPG